MSVTAETRTCSRAVTATPIYSPEVSHGHRIHGARHDYLLDDNVIRQIHQIEAELGTVGAIAEKAVDTILSGGKVHVYSKFWAALSNEANTRMGGLTMFKPVDSDNHKEFGGTDRDFVIMGIYQPEDPVDLAYLDRFLKAGSTVASIGQAARNGVFPEGKKVQSMTETPDCGAGIKSI